jgi:hypothetical protein
VNFISVGISEFSAKQLLNGLVLFCWCEQCYQLCKTSISVIISTQFFLQSACSISDDTQAPVTLRTALIKAVHTDPHLIGRSKQQAVHQILSHRPDFTSVQSQRTLLNMQTHGHEAKRDADTAWLWNILSG